jgi:copper chaperone CopZ
MNQTFTVTGMTCGHCEKAVTRALQQVDPQAQVVIDRAQNRCRWNPRKRAKPWRRPLPKKVMPSR